MISHSDLSTATLEDTERLREILSLQEERELTGAERDEAVRLVDQEDLITLRKARTIERSRWS